MHHVALDRPGPDDGDLDDQVVKACAASSAAASPSARGSRPGTRRSCPPRCISSKVAGSSFGMRARSTGWPRARQISSESCRTAIMPSPSKSTLMMPRSSQSSLSHCATTRPGIDAFSSGIDRIELALADDHAAASAGRDAAAARTCAGRARRRRGQRGCALGSPACFSCSASSSVCGKSPCAIEVREPVHDVLGQS